MTNTQNSPQLCQHCGNRIAQWHASETEASPAYVVCDECAHTVSEFATLTQLVNVGSRVYFAMSGRDFMGTVDEVFTVNGRSYAWVQWDELPTMPASRTAAATSALVVA